MAEPARVAESEAVSSIEDRVDDLIERHNGDARQAIASLILELDMTQVAVSFGYSRGWHHRRQAQSV